MRKHVAGHRGNGFAPPLRTRDGHMMKVMEVGLRLGLRVLRAQLAGCFRAGGLGRRQREKLQGGFVAPGPSGSQGALVNQGWRATGEVAKIARSKRFWGMSDHTYISPWGEEDS